VVHDREYRYSVRHLLDVAVVSDIVAEGPNVPVSDRFSLIGAAMTMNLAMLDLQDRLHVAAGVELTAEDRQQLRSHPERSVATLARLGVTDKKWLGFVLCHHEASDGSGYPQALVGEAIPLGARILSLADAYTARIEQRADRAGLAPQASLREMFVRGGKAVDPLLAAMLVKKVGIYPPGTIVELHNGEFAIVTKRTDNASAPEVHSFMSKERIRYPKMLRKDTAQLPFKIKGALHLDELKVHFNPLQFWAQPA
jgi:HD-GYP domain-containing protein (c-di-GMP phosphodiesterase class II)